MERCVLTPRKPVVTRQKQASSTSRRIISPLLLVTGYILSPLSWWNDLFVNVPLAYIFAVPFGFLHEDLFLPAFITGYILTNVLGFILIHRGIRLIRGMQEPFKQKLKRDIFISIFYILLIVLLIKAGLIKPAHFF